MATTDESFLSLRRTASRLGLPMNWLRAEAEAGRIPHLKAGRRLLFNIAAVEDELLARSRTAEQVLHDRAELPTQ